MIILWILRKKSDGQSQQSENDEASFRKHDESMRIFRLAHPKVETTGLKDVETAERPVLVPIQKVKLANCSQN